METNTALPAVIKLMIVFVCIDVVATLMFFYFDVVSDPDIGFFDIESIVSFVFPPIYLAAMIWLIRTHVPMTKIIIYIVFALELASFMTFDFGASDFDIFAMLSLLSTLALFGCIYLLYTDVGKKWFEKQN